jgi:NAD(P)-dependent dehydrogenase (short-subunit alcohol dehydrogenase family)
MKLSGRRALVTGAGTGMGRAIALALGAQGAAVWLAGRRPEPLTEVAGELDGIGASAVCRPFDITIDDEVRALARDFADGSSLDILVHCAATITLGEIATAPVEELDRQYRVNLRGPYLLTQALLPLLKARRGQVVFVNSSAGQTAPARAGQYAATKFGLRALADSLRAEVNGEGVRVLTIYPGRTATPMGQAVSAMEGRPYLPEGLVQPSDIAELTLTALLLPETAEVTELIVRPMRKLP